MISVNRFHLTQRRLTVTAGPSLVVAVCLASLWVRPRRFSVAGPSMLPTLRPGDRLLVARIGRICVDDLVVLRDPTLESRLICKRVVSRDRSHLVVVGDNPEASTDSRAFGPVPIGLVVGRVLRRYAPRDEPQPKGAGLGRIRPGRSRT